MTWRRGLLWTAGVTGALVLVAAAALHWLVDPEVLRKAARDKARAAWQRELRIGDVSLRLWPVPSVRAAQVAFANPEWCHDRNLLEADNVDADLELMPLLTGKVRLKTLTLQNVRAFLEVADDGAVSWELKDAGSGRVADAPARSGTELLQIGEVHLVNVEVHLRERGKASAPWLIEEARMTTEPRLKDIRAEGRVKRNGRVLEAKARFADLSGYGHDDAATDGRIELEWPEARAVLEGRFPLTRSLAGAALRGEVKGASLQGALAFFGFERGKTAPVHATFALRDDAGRTRIDKLEASLGDARLHGGGHVWLEDHKPVVDVALAIERLDWRRALVDAGGTLKPPHHDGEVFHEDRVAWRALSALGKLSGNAHLTVAALKLGNGLQLEDFKGRVKLGDGRVAIESFTARMLGGNAGGSIAFDAPKKAIRVKLEGDRLLLARWFAERGRKLPFEGGPMKVNASLALSGDTYQALASSATGHATLRMGKASWNSQRAGELEELMVNALAPRDSGRIDFECAVAALEFRDGRVHGKQLFGARSAVSQLVTSGFIDFRDEVIDLRGRVRPRSGQPSLGLATLAGDVQITGTLAKPRIRLDPSQKPAIVARAGAALATAGITLLGTALADAADKNDACHAVGE